MVAADLIIVAFIAVIFNVSFTIATISYCSYMVNKKIQEHEDATTKNKKKPRKNIEKSKVAKKKNKEGILKKLASNLFIGEDIYDFDEDEDGLLSIKDAEDDFDDMTDEEIDNILAEAEKSLAAERNKRNYSILDPKYSDKVISMKDRRQYFKNPQDLVDYAAKRYYKGRIDVYDTRLNKIRQVRAFNVEDGQLLIYYENFTIPERFEPGRFARVA